MRELVHRVRRVFTGHGLLPAHLSQFFAIRNAPFEITFADQQNDTSFLRWLDDVKINWIAETFLVRREWIVGEDKRVFEEQRYDKSPQAFLSVIAEHTDALRAGSKGALADAWFIRFGVGSEWMSKGNAGVFVVVRVPLASLSDEVTVYRYVSDFEPYGWDEGRTAVQLRAWARLLFGKGIDCFGREVSWETGQEIWGNSIFLHDLFEDRSRFKWCQDGWEPLSSSLQGDESALACPDAFFPKVLAFLKDHGLPHGVTRLGDFNSSSR
jgi:hypothetical protein